MGNYYSSEAVLNRVGACLREAASGRRGRRRAKAAVESTTKYKKSARNSGHQQHANGVDSPLDQIFCISAAVCSNSGLLTSVRSTNRGIGELEGTGELRTANLLNGRRHRPRAAISFEGEHIVESTFCQVNFAAGGPPIFFPPAPSPSWVPHRGCFAMSGPVDEAPCRPLRPPTH